jgi:ADP-heptose:LPS heptosyltransferase
MDRAVLVYRPGHLGDTLMALPAILAIRARHPRHHLVLLTERVQRGRGEICPWDVLEPTNIFDDVLFYSPGRNAWKTVATAFGLLRALRRMRPEFVYDLAPERSPRQGRRDRLFFRWLTGTGSYSAGESLTKRRRGAVGSLPRLDPEWRRLLKIAGGDEHRVEVSLPISEGMRAAVVERLTGCGMGPGTPILAVGAGSKMPAKRWPLSRFKDLGKRILEVFPDIHLIVVGGRDDERLGEELCRSWGSRCLNQAGSLSIYESAAVLERCIAYVGNDTGTMHLAATVEIPCVAIFSARDYPGQWEPYGEGHRILRREPDCAGCMLETCGEKNNACLTSISIEDVFHAVVDLVHQSGIRYLGRHGGRSRLSSCAEYGHRVP